MDKYQSLYTPCGHSIKSLKDEAARLAKELKISHKEALDRLAKRLGYSDWREVSNQTPNSIRDDFFRGLYSDRGTEAVDGNYRAFLSQHNLTASKEAYRLFALEHWQGFCKAGLDKVTLKSHPLHPDALVEEVLAVLSVKKGQGLLPRELEDQLLESLCFAGRAAFSPKPTTVEIPEEIKDRYMQALVMCVIGIHVAKNEGSNGFEVKAEDFYTRTNGYYLMLEFELISRRSHIQVSSITLENIFEEDQVIGFRMVDEQEVQ